jgi:uncharacterized protein YigA (DUF484 family)
MTTREARGLPAADAEEETVARYLQHNPEFFERHQALLARLRLPHSRGGSTISLVERQIEVMRERHAALEAKLAELVRVARDNNVIAERFHRFARRLLRAPTRQAALDEIEASLHDDFDAFHSVLLLLGSAPQESAQRFPRSIASDDPNLKSFESLFASAKPRCGQVRDSQREFLFGSDANDIGSVALVPLGEKGSMGLLALGSTERDRFHPGMSTEFLGRMADLIADAVARR